MSTTKNSNSRKVLVPLATLLVAGAVAVGSGATWTAESNSAITASSGEITHVNNQDGATLQVTNLHPGVTESGSLTITNDGDVDSKLSVDPGTATSGFTEDQVVLTMSVAGVELFSGDFDEFTATTPLGDLGVNDSIQVDFTVSMHTDAGNENQTKTAGVALEFVTTSVADADDSSAIWE